jgi:hypothetical protein
MNTRNSLAATPTTAWATRSPRGGTLSSAISTAAGEEGPNANRQSPNASFELLAPDRSESGGKSPGVRPVAEVEQTFGLPRGWLRLIAVGLGIAVIWLVILPSMARLPVIRDHIAAMEEGQIEVDAMFYTELNWKPPRRGSRAGVRSTDPPSATEKSTEIAVGAARGTVLP